MAKNQLATGAIAAAVVATLTAAALTTSGSGTVGVVVARAAFAGDVSVQLSVKDVLRGRETVHVRTAEESSCSRSSSRLEVTPVGTVIPGPR